MHKLLTAEKAASHAAWPGARRGAAGGIDGAAARVPEDWLIEHGSGESNSDRTATAMRAAASRTATATAAPARAQSPAFVAVSDECDSYARRMSDGADFEDDY